MAEPRAPHHGQRRRINVSLYSAGSARPSGPGGPHAAGAGGVAAWPRASPAWRSPSARATPWCNSQPAATTVRGARRGPGLQTDPGRAARRPSPRAGAQIVALTLKPPAAGHPLVDPGARPEDRRLPRGWCIRLWRAHALKPHRVSTFRFTTDPAAEDKIYDVVGPLSESADERRGGEPGREDSDPGPEPDPAVAALAARAAGAPYPRLSPPWPDEPVRGPRDRQRPGVGRGTPRHTGGRFFAS